MRTLASVSIRRNLILPLIVAGSLVGSSVAPAKAGTVENLVNCLLSSCSAETGVVHPVFVVGDTFLPNRIYAEYGDTILIHNLRQSELRLRAKDKSWSSPYLSQNENWAFVLQPSIGKDFSERGNWWGETAKISIGDPPSAVDYGDLVDHQGNIVGKDGSVVRLAEGLGYTLANLGGVLRNLLGGLL